MEFCVRSTHFVTKAPYSISPVAKLAEYVVTHAPARGPAKPSLASAVGEEAIFYASLQPTLPTFALR